MAFWWVSISFSFVFDVCDRQDVSAEQLVERYAQENLLESLVSMSAPRSNVSTPLHVREMPAEAAASVLQMGWLLEGATRSVSHAHDTSDLRYLGEQRRREQEQTQQQVQQGRGQEQNKQQSRAGAQGGGPAGSGASSSSGAGGAGAPKAAGTEESPEEFFTTILQRYPKRGGRSQGGGGSSSSSGKRTAGKSGSRS